MLKVTNIFCKYTKLAYENINYYSIVKQITHFSCRRKTCITSNKQQQLLNPIVPTDVQLRLLNNIKKKVRLRKSQITSNVLKSTHKQMSEPVKPSLNHLSYGSQFEIAEEGNPSNLWMRQTDNIENKQQDIPPDFRTWEPVGKNIDLNNDGFRFKVMSYNVLAQYLLECHPYLYTDCYPKNLKWKVRATKIYNEILNLSPDILCLQEVQVSHLCSFYNKLEEIGYFGIFKQKTGNRQDGCAIYFKQSLFDIQDHISVEFYQPDLPILNRDNIGLMLKLVPKSSPSTPLVVATTHLLYNPKRTDVRLAQLQVLLAEIDRFAFDYNGKERSHLPIILTGDFNSTPDSAVVQLLDRGHVSASSFRDNSDWKKIGVMDNCQHLSVYLNRQKGVTTDFSMIKIYNSDYMECPTEGKSSPPREFNKLFNTGDIGHSLKLTSVYHKVKKNGHIEATTFQDYWVTVDYIYFSMCNSLKLEERLRLPTAEECKVLDKLPNDHYGSDHLALAATFQLQSRSSMSSL